MKDEEGHSSHRRVRSLQDPPCPTVIHHPPLFMLLEMQVPLSCEKATIALALALTLSATSMANVLYSLPAMIGHVFPFDMGSHGQSIKENTRAQSNVYTVRRHHYHLL